jgi:two-component system, cell cycle sensor histidine kinase and response regulator CckA
MKGPTRATVVVVDDEEAVRSFIGSALAMAGHRVILSNSGWESLSICREHDGPIDMALLDVVMPGMSGGELHAELIKLIPDIPIIFMSGYPRNDLEQYGISKTAANFMRKPFTAEELIKTVEKCLHAKRTSRAVAGAR